MLSRRLVLEDQKIQGYPAGSQRVELDFIHLKGKMTPALIGMVVGNLEKDQEKLKYGSATGLTDIVRWTDKLLVELLPYWSLRWGLLLVRGADLPTE